jgi:hypothetical protein
MKTIYILFLPTYLPTFFSPTGGASNDVRVVESEQRDGNTDLDQKLSLLACRLDTRRLEARSPHLSSSIGL